MLSGHGEGLGHWGLLDFWCNSFPMQCFPFKTPSWLLDKGPAAPRATLYQGLAEPELVAMDGVDWPLFHGLWGYPKHTLVRDNQHVLLVAGINFASYFQRRLSITNSEALSFNQKKERKRNWH